MVSIHSRPKAADRQIAKNAAIVVSIHSRPKAAVQPCHLLFYHRTKFQYTAARRRLADPMMAFEVAVRFNTQPPEGGCVEKMKSVLFFVVSIHSRPKAAVSALAKGSSNKWVSIHSRPKAAEMPFSAIFIILRFQYTAARRRLFSLAITTRRV